MRESRWRAVSAMIPGLVGLFTSSCATETAAPEPVLALAATPTAVTLRGALPESVVIRNTGNVVAGPIHLVVPGGFTAAGGNSVPGLGLVVVPNEIPTLGPGTSRVVELRAQSSGTFQDGDYTAVVNVRVTDTVRAVVGVVASVKTHQFEPFSSLEITGGPTTIRQGDVVTYTVQVRDTSGVLAVDPNVIWSVVPPSGGYFGVGGRFVAYMPGALRLVAEAGMGTDTLDVSVGARGLSGTVMSVGSGSVTARYTSDLWVHGSAAYTGTWGMRSQHGNMLYVWDVSTPSSPVRADSVRVDARTVNDVKVSADGRLAVITHEGSQDAKNGITLLDLADPLHPTVITRFTTTLESGVHNVWIDGNYVYASVDGVSPSSGLRILDVSDPANPSIAASYYAGSSFLHDVYVRDGLAFLSHWNAGLVILDVGHGIVGGSPTSPKEVGGIWTEGGQTHNVWYWPGGGYAFVGEEDFSTPGVMHVVDVRDLANPREVATFRVPGTTPHNFWLDEANEVLYLAWYGNGLRVVDVSGELLGELDKQGREIIGVQYAGPGSCPASTGTPTCAWAPQLNDGYVYLADMNAGLRVFQPMIP